MIIPLTILVAGGLALVGVAWRWQVYPHQPLIVLFLVPVVLSLWLVALPWIWPWLVGIDCLLALGMLVDVVTLARANSFEVERHLGRTVSLGKSHLVKLTLTNRADRDQPVWIRDGLPAGLSGRPGEFCVPLPSRSRSNVHYKLKAARRGAFELSTVFLRVRSRWGLWQRLLELPCPSAVSVYPDMKQLAEYALLARTNRLSLLGVRRTRRVGQDNEFERLRDYTRDDNYRHIDWRSTARRRKLTVKDFQANQSQRLVFLVDCGRMMTPEARGMSLLDHALNATLMLSYVALRQGDQVGLVCFSDSIHTFVPPRGGRGQMKHLLHAAYDRFPRMVESRYDEAFLHLAAHVRKRALVVLITNLIDEVNARQIERHVRAIAGRHLPLGVLLRDHALFDAVEGIDLDRTLGPISSGPGNSADQRPDIGTTIPQPGSVAGGDTAELFTAAAAAQIITWRHRVLTELETQGALSLDVFPEDLVAPLVNRYLELKARHLL